MAAVITYAVVVPSAAPGNQHEPWRRLATRLNSSCSDEGCYASRL